MIEQLDLIGLALGEDGRHFRTMPHEPGAQFFALWKGFEGVGLHEARPRDKIHELDLRAGAVALDQNGVPDALGQLGPAHPPVFFRPDPDRDDGRKRSPPPPDFDVFLHGPGGLPAAGGFGVGFAVMEIIGAHGRFLAEGTHFVDRQAGGEEVFILRLLVGEGEDGVVVAHDEGAARPDGQADEVVAIKRQQQVGDVRAHGVGHTLGEALQDVFREGDAFAGEPDLGKEAVRAVEPETVDAAQRGVLDDLLGDGQPCDAVGIGQGIKPQLIRARVVEDAGIHHRGPAQYDLVKAVGAFVHAGDAAGQRAEKLEVQRAVQLRQLVRVRIKGDIAEPLFDHLELLTVVGLKRVMFHGRVLRHDY